MQLHLYVGFSSVVNATVLHDPKLVESVATEPRLWMADCRISLECGLRRRSAPVTPTLFKGQLHYDISLERWREVRS